MSITQCMKTVEDADTSNNNKSSSSNNNSDSDSKVTAASAAKNDQNKSKKTKVVVFGSTRAIGMQLITTLSKNYTNWEIVAVVCRRGNNNNNSLLSFSSTTLPTNNNIRIVQGDSTNKDDVLSLSQDADIVFSCTVRGDVFVTQPKTHSVASSRAACLWSWKRIAI